MIHSLRSFFARITRSRVSSSVIALVLVASSFGAGIAVGVARSVSHAQNFATISFGTSDAPTDADLSQFWTVWHILDDRFVPTTASSTKADDQKKIWGAIQGLTGAYGDPYTTFFPPEESKAFQEQVSGNFEGVGMEIGIRNQQLLVISPIAGTPAERAGMRPKDAILSIDGKSTEGMSVEAAVKLIRGPHGTTVTLSISRDKGEPQDVSIVRDVINVPAIKAEARPDGVFVVSIYSFSGLSVDQFRTAMRQFVENGSSRLVLDLRGNPGGFLEAAVDMASYFLPLGETVVTEDFGGKQTNEVHHSKGYDIFRSRGKEVKMAVLIDAGSASASEILAGALRDQGVATLVGKKSFGKGSVQELIDLGGGASLKVTIAKWLTPHGTSISQTGVMPDIEVDRTADDFKNNKDPQMDSAVDYLLKH